jgi:hypothetical protein
MVLTGIKLTTSVLTFGVVHTAHSAQHVTCATPGRQSPATPGLQRRASTQHRTPASYCALSPSTSGRAPCSVAVSVRSASFCWSRSRSLRYTTRLLVATLCSSCRPHFALRRVAFAYALAVVGTPAVVGNPCFIWRLTARVFARQACSTVCGVGPASCAWCASYGLFALACLAALSAFARCFLDGILSLLSVFSSARGPLCVPVGFGSCACGGAAGLTCVAHHG